MEEKKRLVCVILSWKEKCCQNGRFSATNECAYACAAKRILLFLFFHNLTNSDSTFPGLESIDIYLKVERKVQLGRHHWPLTGDNHTHKRKELRQKITLNFAWQKLKRLTRTANLSNISLFVFALHVKKTGEFLVRVTLANKRVFSSFLWYIKPSLGYMSKLKQGWRLHGNDNQQADF